MKHVKQISLLAIALLLIVVQLIIPASAANTVLADLIPSKDTKKGTLTLTGCTMTENNDGSVTFTLTATSATFKMVFAENVFKEGGGGTIISGDAFDVTKGAYVVYDYASADNVTLTAIAHYTRKDKAASNALADLYLNSMEGSDYAKYQKQVGKGYGVWDLGTYISVDKKDSGLFDDHLHRICNFEGTLTGKVGAKLTIYKFYVSSTHDVKDLGKVRPEPTPVNTSSAASSTSSVATSSEVTSSTATSSTATSSVATSSAASSTASVTSSAASVATSSAQSSSAGDSDTTESSNWWIYVVIGVAVVAVAGVVIYFVTKKKN